MRKRIIIGGPPSSGSSLLATMLGRHQDIYSIQETHLLSKLRLWEDWKTAKQNLLSNKYHSPGWHMQPKIDHIENAEALNTLSKSADSLLEMADQYFSMCSIDKDKSHWLEKTPSNVYFFHKFANLVENYHCVLTVRHPFDIVASLLFRKSSLLTAVSRTLVNMTVGFYQAKHMPVRVLKYEELVKKPASEINDLLAEMSIPFEKDVIHSTNGKTRMKGWKNFEDGEISKSSIHRFYELDLKTQQQIVYLAKKIKVNPAHLETFNIPGELVQDMTLVELTSHYNYEVPEIDGNRVNLKFASLRDKIARRINGHPTFNPYPIVL